MQRNQQGGTLSLLGLISPQFSYHLIVFHRLRTEATRFW